MDAVPHGRATALGLPLAAPRHGEVVRVAVPERLAHRDQRSTERPVLQQPANVCGGGAGALLEDDGQLTVGGDRGSAHLVEFVERGCGRLLDHDVRAGGERLEGLTVMRSGRRADEHDVGVLGGEQFVEVVVDGRHVPLRRRSRRPPTGAGWSRPRVRACGCDATARACRLATAPVPTSAQRSEVVMRSPHRGSGVASTLEDSLGKALSHVEKETALDYIHLGRTGTTVSRIVLGTMNFGDRTSERRSVRHHGSGARARRQLLRHGQRLRRIGRPRGDRGDHRPLVRGAPRRARRHRPRHEGALPHGRPDAPTATW